MIEARRTPRTERTAVDSQAFVTNFEVDPHSLRPPLTPAKSSDVRHDTDVCIVTAGAESTGERDGRSGGRFPRTTAQIGAQSVSSVPRRSAISRWHRGCFMRG